MSVNREKMRVAVIGCGRFAKNFVPLFKAHPVVEKVYVCDIRRERAEQYAAEFGVEIIDSFEEALASKEINAIAIFTQRFTHGEMAIRSLEAGKHVYSSVPCAISVDEIIKIEKLVREKHLLYSMGETGYYRAPAIYCRREFKKGTFGKFVYAEAQYNHDIRNMEESYKSSAGEEHWKSFAGIPPMFYPTHSTSMVLSAMPGVYATEVMAMGFSGSPRTDIYGTDGQNRYDNPFSNEAMMLRLSNGGIARISENRCVGWASPETYISQFYGTEGGYEFSVAHHHQSHWDSERHGKVIMTDVTQELQPPSVYKMINEDYSKAIQEIADTAGFFEESPIQDVSMMPESYLNLRSGHNGTHKFLINDFCRAFGSGKLTPTNIWEVARYNIPGLICHESAMQGGKLLPVPDLGDAPKDWEVIDSL